MKITIFKFLYICLILFIVKGIEPSNENRGEIGIITVGVSERCFKRYDEIVRKKKIKLDGFEHTRIIWDFRLSNMFDKEIDSEKIMEYRKKREFKFVSTADKSMVRIKGFFLVSSTKENEYNCVFNKEAISIDYYVFHEIVDKVPGVFVLDKYNRYWYYVNKVDLNKIDFKKIKKQLVSLYPMPFSNSQYEMYHKIVEEDDVVIRLYDEHRMIVNQINYEYPEIEGFLMIQKERFNRIESPKKISWIKGRTMCKNDDLFFLILKDTEYPFYCIYNKNKINVNYDYIRNIIDYSKGYFVKDRYNRIWFYFEDKGKCQLKK